MSPAIRVAVYDDSKREHCEGHCGMDCLQPANQHLIRTVLEQTYGNQVSIEYVDLGKEDIREQELAGAVRSGNFMLPLVSINGKPRLSGYFDIRQLQEAIETELEISGE